MICSELADRVRKPLAPASMASSLATQGYGIVSGMEDDGRARRRAADHACRGESAHPGKPVRQQDDVRRLAQGRRYRFGGAPDYSADHDAWFAGEDVGDRMGQDLVVLHDQHPSGRFNL
jgi:hypothetical protein